MSSDAGLAESDPNSFSGYLSKKTRDGRWQKRWFETNGNSNTNGSCLELSPQSSCSTGLYLTYYKSRKMEKLLAALSLPQGKILY